MLCYLLGFEWVAGCVLSQYFAVYFSRRNMISISCKSVQYLVSVVLVDVVVCFPSFFPRENTVALLRPASPYVV